MGGNVEMRARKALGLWVNLVSMATVGERKPEHAFFAVTAHKWSARNDALFQTIQGEFVTDPQQVAYGVEEMLLVSRMEREP